MLRRDVADSVWLACGVGEGAGGRLPHWFAWLAAGAVKEAAPLPVMTPADDRHVKPAVKSAQLLVARMGAAARCSAAPQW
jgi:hypothetical protein